MSVFIDRKFLKLLSPKLERFTQKKDDLYNFRCPFCGDSAKHKHKARGYVYRKKNDYFYKCQNCGIGHTMYNFIDYMDPNMAKDYTMERFISGEVGNHNYPKPIIEIEPPKFLNRVQVNLPKISELPDGHYAKEYCLNRELPEKTFSRLYYAADFKKFVDEILPNHEKELKEDDPRLIIPFYDVDGSLLAVQGRALRDSKIRYITIKINEESVKMFGLDTVDIDEKIYVFEGPLDSMFIDNAAATADSNLMAASRYLPKDKMILVYDNEPRNKDIVKQMEKAIDQHYQICIWPEMVEEKDINEMVLGGYTSDEICDIIDQNTFVNLRAKVEFVHWKKV